MTPEQSTKPFEVRAEHMLSKVFGGMHHVHSLKKEPNYWSCIHHGDLSTYDFMILTRLVIAAHDYCIRVELTNGGPRRIKIHLHPRQREGRVYERHPTMEDAINDFRRS